MTRTNVTDIKVAYRPNHTYACRFALLIMWSTFSGTRHFLMSSPTFSSASYPTEFSKSLPTTPSQTTSYIFPTFPTTFLLYSNDNKANEWLCRKWKDSYHLFTVMNKYWLGWINSCYLLACPRKYVGRPWKEERTKTLLNHFGKQDIRSFFKSSDNWGSPETTTFYKSYFLTNIISSHNKSQVTKVSLKNWNNFGIPSKNIFHEAKWTSNGLWTAFI